MSVKIEIEWWLSSEKPYPEKPGKYAFESLMCCVVHKRKGAMLLQWNCNELAWFDIWNEVHYCDAPDIHAWAIIPKPPDENEWIAT